MISSIKKITNNLFYLKLAKVEDCSLCGKELLTQIEQLIEQQIPINARLIFDTGDNNCNAFCTDNFLAGMAYFKSIAYVVKQETATRDPWLHAMLVHKKNNNTHYCDSYDEAYTWSLFQDQKEA